MRELDEETRATRICDERGWRDESRQSPREKHGWERWQGGWAGCHRGHKRLKDSHRQAGKIIADIEATMRRGRKGKDGERVFGHR